MSSVVSALSQNFDFIIFDLPPVNAVSDGLVISKLIQGMIVVVRQDYSDRQGPGRRLCGSWNICISRCWALS